MGQSIHAQAASLLFACAGGAGLGLLYDLLRPVRRRSGDTLWDLLFCLCAAGLAFTLAMHAESGMLGTGEIAFCLAGLLLYLWLLSPLLFPIFEKAAKTIGVLFKKTQFFTKKVWVWIKKLFQISLG